jgi:hypothetical protein
MVKGPLAVPCTCTEVEPPAWMTRFQSKAVRVGLDAVPPSVAWYDAVSRPESDQVHPTCQDDDATADAFRTVICPRKPPGQAERVCQVAVHVFWPLVVVVVVGGWGVVVSSKGSVVTLGIDGELNGEVFSLTDG